MINICNGTTKLDISADDDSLLVGAFDWPKPHVRPDHRFANHPRIRGVVLPTLDIRLHVTGGISFTVCPKLCQFALGPGAVAPMSHRIIHLALGKILSKF
jgi:hypothetical protein